ncbi:MAG: hypothetical protein WCA76_16340 [Candidatus Sulfotelmatobacter sp.]
MTEKKYDSNADRQLAYRRRAATKQRRVARVLLARLNRLDGVRVQKNDDEGRSFILRERGQREEQVDFTDLVLFALERSALEPFREVTIR